MNFYWLGDFQKSITSTAKISKKVKISTFENLKSLNLHMFSIFHNF